MVMPYLVSEACLWDLVCRKDLREQLRVSVVRNILDRGEALKPMTGRYPERQDIRHRLRLTGLSSMGRQGTDCSHTAISQGAESLPGPEEFL